MSVKIKTEETLKAVLHEMIQQNENLFDGRYAAESDGPLYQGLVGAYNALMKDDSFRSQEALKRLQSVEAGCKIRLKPEYWTKFEACVAFLQADIGHLYVELMMNVPVRQWLEHMKRIYME